MRIGLVGTESDHAEDLLRLLNREHRHPGLGIAALWGAPADAERTGRLAAAYGAPAILASPATMLERVDAVIVADRDSRLHLAHALPFLAAGLPVFVDKPLAATVADAGRMLDAAARSGAPLLSASALRWQADTLRLRQQAATLGPLRRVVARGSFQPQSPYGGSVFYGVHTVALALELAGAAIEAARVVEADATALTLAGRVGAIEVEMRMTVPEPGAGSSFAAELIGADGRLASPIALPDDYMAPVLRRIVEMFIRRIPPLGREALLAPVRLLELGEAALRERLGP